MYARIENVGIEKVYKELQMPDVQNARRNLNLEGMGKVQYTYAQVLIVILEKKHLNLKRDLMEKVKLIKEK